MNTLTSDLIDFINTNYLPEEKIKASKDGGTTIFFRKGGKSLCYIETKDEKSTVTVVIGASLNDKIQSSDASSKTKEMFNKAKQFHDGKWLFFNMQTNEDLEDVKALLKIKRQPSKKRLVPIDG